jgi:hypothetical protein
MPRPVVVSSAADPQPVPYIEDLEEVRDYILHMDFSWQKYKMENDRFVVGWSRAKLDFAEKQYKNFLFLWRKYRGKPLPPPFQVDDFWHGHILHTNRYHIDCIAIFGEYLHHYPYFGMRGDGDREGLENAFLDSQRLYRAEFGDWIRDYVDLPAAPPPSVEQSAPAEATR